MANDVAKPPLKVRLAFPVRANVQSSVRVMALIHSLCVMLQTTPFHRENYSRLIVGVIVQYYQQCSARFKGESHRPEHCLVAELASLGSIQSTLTEPPLALPAVWAQRDDMISCLTEVRAVIVRLLVSGLADLVAIRQARARERWRQRDQAGNGPAWRHTSDRLAAHPVIAQAGILGQPCREFGEYVDERTCSHAQRWFVDSLLDLQTVAEEPLSPGTEVPSNQVS
jgi:exocyst complex component 4